MKKKIGIIDAEVLNEKRHPFPNLACMKISGYYKSLGYETELITKLNKMNTNTIWLLNKSYEKIFVSKVFTETSVPSEILQMDCCDYGGTGFFYSDAEPLPDYIEHQFPDYHLYDDWVNKQLENGKKRSDFKYYLDYSIGYATRGCIRKCAFCVNRKYNKVFRNSCISEFYDESRPYICLLDDNILAYENWKEVFEELNATGKKFEFTQGMDIRILDEERINVILKSNYEMNGIGFAFDKINETELIIEKMKLWRQYYSKTTHMFILCGFDSFNKYDENFWVADIQDLLYRIKVCMEYGFLPYVMRYRKYKMSPYKGLYILLASWCNQHSSFIKQSLREFTLSLQKATEIKFNSDKIYSSLRYLLYFEEQHPDIAKEYFDLKYEEFAKYQYSNIAEDYIKWFGNLKYEIIEGCAVLPLSPTALTSIKKHSVDLVSFYIKDTLENNEYKIIDKSIEYLMPTGVLCITIKQPEVVPMVEKYLKSRNMQVNYIGKVKEINGFLYFIYAEQNYRKTTMVCDEIRAVCKTKIENNCYTLEEKMEYNRYVTLLRKSKKHKNEKKEVLFKEEYMNKIEFWNDIIKNTTYEKNDLMVNICNNYTPIIKANEDIGINIISLRKKRNNNRELNI